VQTQRQKYKHRTRMSLCPEYMYSSLAQRLWSRLHGLSMSNRKSTLTLINKVYNILAVTLPEVFKPMQPGTHL
jgi:hypothetical protein